MKNEPKKITIGLNTNFLVISFGILAVLIGALGGQVFFKERPGVTGHVVTGEQVALPEAGQTLISGVLCPCGRCSDMLTVCSCETAIDIKRTINRLLSQDKSREDLKKSLESKYGKSLFNYTKD